jgi:hypothetical protein
MFACFLQNVDRILHSRPDFFKSFNLVIATGLFERLVLMAWLLRKSKITNQFIDDLRLLKTEHFFFIKFIKITGTIPVD